MTSPSTRPARYVSIADAADILGAKPWDVVRLIEADKVRSIQLVDVESLRHQRGGQA